MLSKLRKKGWSIPGEPKSQKPKSQKPKSQKPKSQKPKSKVVVPGVIKKSKADKKSKDSEGSGVRTPAIPGKDRAEEIEDVGLSSEEGDGELLIDLSKIDPREDWMCFGHFEHDHFECDDCPVRKDCAAEQGIET